MFSLGMCAVFCCLQRDVPAEFWRDVDRAAESLGVSFHLKEVLRKAIAWDRHNRFSSVLDFSQNLLIAMNAPPTEGHVGRLAGEIGARILIVDDEKFIRDICSDFLSMEGYQVELADSRERARELVHRSSYDLILLDLKISGVKGLDLLRELRQLAPRTVLVMMSGFATAEIAIDAMKLGARDFILKPFKVEDLVLRIGKTLASSGADNTRR